MLVLKSDRLEWHVRIAAAEIVAEDQEEQERKRAANQAARPNG